MPTKRNKYNNKKCLIDGIMFDSKLEAKYYEEVLKPQIQSNEITVKFHPKYVLIKSFTKYGKKHNQLTYSADFLITVLETQYSYLVDTKGMVSKDFIIKRKLFDALYDIELKVITWDRKNKTWSEI